MRKRNLLAFLLIGLCACGLAFALSSCNGNQGDGNQNNGGEILPDDKGNHENQKPQGTLSNKAEILSVTDAEISGTEIYLFTSNDSVWLGDMVQCSEHASWKLYSDAAGKREIPTKIASAVRYGTDNFLFYLVVTAQDGVTTKTYTLNLSKHFNATLSFYAFDGYKSNWITLTSFSVSTKQEFQLNYDPTENPDYLKNFAPYYEFNFWRDENGNRIDTIRPREKFISVYADLTPKTFQFALDVNGGNKLEKDVVPATYGASCSLPVPTKDSYHLFAGWYCGDSYVTSEDGTLKWKDFSYSGTTLTAKWIMSPNHPDLLPFEIEIIDKNIKILKVKDTDATEIVVPDSVTEIADGAFFGCKNLVSLSLPFTKEYMGSIFGSEWYEGSVIMQIVPAWYDDDHYNDGDTRSYYLPARLTTIKITDSTYIARNAFAFFPVLNVILQPDVTEIRDYAFYGCSNLISIEGTDNVSQLGFKAFDSCEALTSVNFPNVTKLGRLFNNCTALVSVNLPNVTELDGKSFRNCTALTSIELPSVITIGYGAFEGCTNLKSISFPNVTNIFGSVFSSCNSIILSSNIKECHISFNKNTTCYYFGTRGKWENWVLPNSDEYLKNLTVRFYSEIEPPLNEEGTDYNDEYWHYDADGNPVPWTI